MHVLEALLSDTAQACQALERLDSKTQLEQTIVS